MKLREFMLFILDHYIIKTILLGGFVNGERSCKVS